MASIYSLPVELKETIFAETSFLDLNNLSKTCKSIRAVALPALFRQIALIWDANLSNCPPIVALFRCILENPNLGKMVKELHLQTQGYRGFSSLGSNSDMLLPIHTHCFTAQDWGIFQKALQSCSGEENNENVDPTTQERDLNAAISILISHCTRIELLRMDIELLVNNHRFPTMLQSTLCQTLSHLGKQPWVEKLVSHHTDCLIHFGRMLIYINFAGPCGRDLRC
jgi:hypothetical protein